MTAVAVHVERTGGTGPTVLLLHGAGATAAVWAPVLAELDRRGEPAGGDGAPNVLTADLPGHGRSGRSPGYHHGEHATAVGSAVRAALGATGTGPAGAPARIDLVVGHSLGGLVALETASGRHGLDVGAVAALAVRTRWTPDELAARADRSAREPRVFPTPEPVRRHFARVGGLPPDTADELLDTGVRRSERGYLLAVDPRLGQEPPAGPDELARVAAAVTVPVRLACGDADPGIRPEDMSAVLGRPVQVVAGAGHNLHIDRPAFVADLITCLTTGSRTHA